jgi:O-antigen/teichoic acid export membrane protein
MTRTSSRQKIIGNTLFSLLSELSLLFTVVFSILAARFLGDREFGKLGAAVGFVGIFTLFIVFGFSYSIPKIINRRPENAGAAVWNALIIQASFSLACAVVCMSVAGLLRTKYTADVRILIGIVFIAETFRCFVFTLRAAFKTLGRFHYDTIAVNAERIFLLLAGTWVLIQTRNVIWAAVVLALSRAISFFILVFFLFRDGLHRNAGPSLAGCRMLMADSWIYAIQTGIFRLYDSIDLFMLSLMRPFAEVGWYRAGRQIIDGLTFIPNVLTEVVYPEMNSRHMVSDRMVTRLFERSFKYILITAVFVGLAVILFSGRIVALIYSPDYVRTVAVLAVLGISVIPAYIRYLFGNILIAINLQKSVLAVSGIRVGLNLVLNYILIRSYGYMGAAAATVAVEVFSFGVYAYLLKKQKFINRSQWAFAFKPILAGAAVLVLQRCMPDMHFLVRFFILFLSYIGVIFALKTFDREEMSAFKLFIIKKLKYGSEKESS